MVEIRISDLSHEFDDREVLSAVDFVCSGSSLAVTGPNGSGKSTLLRIIAGLLTPLCGCASISIDGNPVPRGSLRNLIGLAAPDVRLYADLTARENLRFLMRARSMGAGEERILQVLEEVGLRERADDPVGELSSGLRQRAALAAALVHSPLLLLLDEPSTNLDEAGAQMVRAVVDAQKQRGMVVIATNDPSEAELAVERLDLGALR